MDEAAGLAFRHLGPEAILDAVESTGRVCDGRLLALNSYENRVYQVGLENAEPLVVKFYRPERWSDAAIMEEHDLTLELAALELPVVPPLIDAREQTLHRHGPFRFALYPRRGGRPPDLESPEHLEQLGRFVARLHNVGAIAPFRHRPALTVEAFGRSAYRDVLASGFLPADLEVPYRTLAEQLIEGIEACFRAAGAVPQLRLHGDFHPGNILWTDAGPHVVDFDDARTGPAIQDLWMFLAGDRSERTAQLLDLLEGYTQFRDFDARELRLVEALRTLRLLHYSAWIARRWEDPAFPRAFPWFAASRYWEEHILALREQAAAMDEEPLRWD